MPNDKPYIERKYVTLEQLPIFITRESWLARVDGVSSTGEYIKMSRLSRSAGEALLLLTEALEEQGYALR